jgi:hypothetical protein
MFENGILTRCAICGTGLLLGGIVFLAHLPVPAIVVPVVILFLGLRRHHNPMVEKNPTGFFDNLVAEPEETHAIFYGMLNALGIFELPALTEEERGNWNRKKHYFWFGEVALAAALAGCFAVPAGIFLAGRTETPLAFIGAAVLFLLLFVFLPRLLRLAMQADTAAAIDTFGKNEHLKKVVLSVIAAIAGLALGQVANPVSAQQVVAALMGTGG